MKAVCLCILLILLPRAIPAQQIQISTENKTIAISTSDEASALADAAVVSIGFTSYGKEQESTYADATRTSNSIIDSLTSAGVPKDAIASSEQHLSAIDANGDEDKARYGQGLRFEFAQSWQGDNKRRTGRQGSPPRDLERCQ